MSLEAATYISQLSQSNPTSSDPTGQGDDHIRLIKGVLKDTFPNASSPQFFRESVAEVTSVTPSNADAGKAYPINASGGAVSVNLPGTPNNGDVFEFFKSDFSSYVVTIAGNGNTINGLTSLILFKPYQKVKVQYSTALGGWLAETDRVIETGTFIDNSAATLQDAIIADGTKTLGNSSSGADYLGNRYRQLYEHLYVNYSNTTCPVNGGRTGSNLAAAITDWNANKRITMPSLNGYLRATSDTQGGGVGNRITDSGTGNSGISAAPGSVGGAQNYTITRANLPDVAPTITINDPGHNHTLTGAVSASAFNAGAGGSTVCGGRTTATISTETTGITATCQSLNGGTTQTLINKMPPTFITRTHMAL